MGQVMVVVLGVVEVEAVLVVSGGGTGYARYALAYLQHR